MSNVHVSLMIRTARDLMLIVGKNGRTRFWFEFTRAPSPNARHHLGRFHWSVFD